MLECWEITTERSATLQFGKLKARKTATGPKSETDLEKDQGRQTQRDAEIDMHMEKQRHRGRNGKNRERESESQKDKRVSRREKDGKGWKSQTQIQSC